VGNRKILATASAISDHRDKEPVVSFWGRVLNENETICGLHSPVDILIFIGGSVSGPAIGGFAEKRGCLHVPASEPGERWRGYGGNDNFFRQMANCVIFYLKYSEIK
jgi:hypothetical protein